MVIGWKTSGLSLRGRPRRVGGLELILRSLRVDQVEGDIRSELQLDPILRSSFRSYL